MAITRADAQSQTARKQEFYSDFLDSFAASPFGGSLAKATNERAVKQSIKNLVLTNLGGFDLNTNKRIAGERFFQPLVGSDVNRSLFENSDLSTFTIIKQSIEDVITNYEPRANNVTVDVTGSNDEQYMIINIVFTVINNNNPVNLTLNLRRVR